MPHDVIMPALGMTQDTGKLVSWLKNEGDPVKVGDILFEVETDKSTMEVDAQAEGFLTGICAAAGDDVPVGNVIALISQTPGAATPAEKTVRQAQEAEATPATDVPSPVDRAHEPIEQTIVAVPPTGDRILASPKAKRIAAELGLDLSDLARTGHAQPYHFADIEVLKSLAARAASALPSTDVQPADASRFLALEARTKGLNAFLEWMQTDGNIRLETPHVWASYAAACLRKATQAEDTVLSLRVTRLDGTTASFLDADRQRLSKMVSSDDEATPDFIVRDITDNPITQMRLGAREAPVLTIAKSKKHYLLSLEFTSRQMTDDQAIAFMLDFCARLNDPLKHVL